jgi:hypothetical protein
VAAQDDDGIDGSITNQQWWIHRQPHASMQVVSDQAQPLLLSGMRNLIAEQKHLLTRIAQLEDAEDRARMLQQLHRDPRDQLMIMPEHSNDFVEGPPPSRAQTIKQLGNRALRVVRSMYAVIAKPTPGPRVGNAAAETKHAAIERGTRLLDPALSTASNLRGLAEANGRCVLIQTTPSASHAISSRTFGHGSSGHLNALPSDIKLSSGTARGKVSKYMRLRLTCQGWEAAHRLVLWTFEGPPPDATDEVTHLCNNKNCLNPAHMVWVSVCDSSCTLWLAMQVDLARSYLLTCVLIAETMRPMQLTLAFTFVIG